MKKILHLMVGGQIGGIEVLCREYGKFSVHKNYFAILWEPGELSKEMRECGLSVIELNVGKRAIVATIFKLYNMVQNLRIDTIIVHHASPKMHIYMHIVSLFVRRVSTVAYAHGFAELMYRKEEGSGRLFRYWIMKYSLRLSDTVVAISNAVKRSLITEFSLSSNNINVIYNGVDGDQFFRRKRNPSDGILKIIYVGRLIKDKGVQVILEALGKIGSDFEYQFTVVGDGEYKDELVSMTKKLGLENKVIFLGSRRDIPDILSSSDVFVHVPLLKEGFGITIIEAMACGLICVCSRIGAIPEICDGKNSMLISPGNADELVDCMRKITSLNEQERDMIRKNAQKTAKTYNINAFVNELDAMVEIL